MPAVAKFLIEHTISPQPTIRVYAQRYVLLLFNHLISLPVSLRAFVKLATFIKIRSYAKSDVELWLDEWSSPLQGQIPVTAELIADLQCPTSVDKQ